MKTAIIQLDYYKKKDYLTKRYQILYKYCVPSIKQYSEIHNIDYFLIKKEYNAISNKHTNYKSDFYYDLHENYKDYDSILFIDLDVTAINTKDNIFNELYKKKYALSLAEANQEQLAKGNEWLQRNNYGISATKRPNSCIILFNNCLSNIYFNKKNKLIINLNDYVNDEYYLMLKTNYFYIPIYYWSHDEAAKWNFRDSRTNRSKKEFKDIYMKHNIHFIHWASSIYDDNGIDIGDRSRKDFEKNILWHLTSLEEVL